MGDAARGGKKLPGYGPDIEKNRAEGREIMQQLGCGPDKPLSIKVTTRNVQPYRDPAVLLIDQLKHVYIDGELEVRRNIFQRSCARISRSP